MDRAAPSILPRMSTLKHVSLASVATLAIACGVNTSSGTTHQATNEGGVGEGAANTGGDQGSGGASGSTGSSSGGRTHGGSGGTHGGSGGGSLSSGGAQSSGGTQNSGGAQSSGGTTGSGGYVSNGSGGTDNGVPSGCNGATPTITPIGTAAGTPGVWQNVSPAGLTFVPSLWSNDNFGLQDILTDPVRPSDLYAFVCHQGVWKSTDYGSTWNKVNTGNNGSVIDSGKPWGSGIDTNKCRDPNTPPTLYTLNGNGQMGFWKSTDGGVNWTRTALPDQAALQYDQDAYSISVDPYDGKHIIMGFHEMAGLVESTDGGASFQGRTPGDQGMSVYPNFIDTGDPATTRKTWLTIGQTGTMQLTQDGAASWRQVETLTHPHGNSQIFQAGGGVIYVGGVGGTQGDGIYRSQDFGSTWTKVSSGAESDVVGTATMLYAAYAWAYGPGGVDPALKTSLRSSGTSWTSVATPSGMTNGWKGAAVTHDGSHYVIVTGNWNSGIWRYIEP
jgi:hypothetical protein